MKTETTIFIIIAVLFLGSLLALDTVLVKATNLGCEHEWEEVAVRVDTNIHAAYSLYYPIEVCFKCGAMMEGSPSWIDKRDEDVSGFFFHEKYRDREEEIWRMIGHTMKE